MLDFVIFAFTAVVGLLVILIFCWFGVSLLGTDRGELISFCIAIYYIIDAIESMSSSQLSIT